MIYQFLSAYFEDDCADELTNDPILTAILKKQVLVSQPTLTRFFHRMNEATLNQFFSFMCRFQKAVDIPLLLRGDSGFTKPELYHQCETNGVSYAIRLKENGILRELASDIEEQLTKIAKDDIVSYAVCYGEFMYQTGSWDYPHSIVCKVEKTTEQIVHMDTFIVTNMDS